MRNVKYYYDENSATYQAVVPNKKKRLIQLGLLGLGTLLLGLFFAFIGVTFIFKQPVDKALTREVDELKMQYKLLAKNTEKNTEKLTDIEKRDNDIYRSYFNLDTLSKDVRKAGYGGTDRYAKYNKLKHASMISQIAKKIEQLNKRLTVQAKSFDQIETAALKREREFNHIPAIKPISNKDLKRIASGFGLRLHPILKVGKMHDGLDFAVDHGKPIYATADGVVEVSDWQGGYGKVILIDHQFGYKTKYAHMSRLAVAKGAHIKRGELIGYVGSTGMSSGPHLHYEVIKENQKVDPIRYFYQDVSPDQFKQLYDDSQKMSVSLD